MEPRKATEEEQLKIDEASRILFDVGLSITELKDGNGAVTPLRAPKL